MKGFIEIPATEDYFAVSVNIAYITRIIDSNDSTTIEMVDSKKHYTELKYEQVKELINNAIK